MNKLPIFSRLLWHFRLKMVGKHRREARWLTAITCIVCKSCLQGWSASISMKLIRLCEAPLPAMPSPWIAKHIIMVWQVSGEWLERNPAICLVDHAKVSHILWQKKCFKEVLSTPGKLLPGARGSLIPLYKDNSSIHLSLVVKYPCLFIPMCPVTNRTIVYMFIWLSTCMRETISSQGVGSHDLVACNPVLVCKPFEAKKNRHSLGELEIAG